MSDDLFTDDNELRGIAMAAFHEHERTVSPAETEAALTAVRSRIDAGDPGGTSPVLFTEGEPRRGRPLWMLLGAAAAVIGMVGAGLVAVIGSGRTDVVPSTLPAAESTIDSTVTETVPVTTLAEPTGTTIAPTAVGPQTIAVDAANPPPLIEPRLFASIPLEPNPNGNRVSVAIGSDVIAVQQPDTTFVSLVDTVEDPGAIRNLEIEGRLYQVVIGPGDVAYGFGGVIIPAEGEPMPGPLPIVAIALSGDRPGQVVAQELLDTNIWLELPAAALGHGVDGVIGRTRQPNDTLIEYVDTDGRPMAWPGEAPPVITSELEADGGRRVVSVADGPTWNLLIARDPAASGSYTGPSPVAPTSAGRVIYSDRIGANAAPDQDFSPDTMPVIAILNSDGSGSWVRLPDDWDVVASDVWGTVLGREIDGVLELALLDESLEASAEPPVATPTTLADPVGDGTTGAANDVLAIVNNCSVDSQCTLLANTENGRLVAYDPSVDAFLIYDESGRQLQSEVAVAEPLALAQPYIEHIGPDDVVYVSIPTPGSNDPSRDLLAIPLVGSSAGTVVMRWTGLDGSGDSSLIPRKAGLAVVGCCGPQVPRPSADASIYLYVDRNGASIESTAPTFRLDLGDAGSNLARINEDGSSTFFALPTVLQYPRDFPVVVPTDDGGALAADFDQITQRSVIVRFRADWPEFGIDNSDVFVFADPYGFGPELLEPSGTVIVADGLQFIRRTVGQIATPGWPGAVEIGVEGGTVAAPGLNDYIAANQPAWADDPVLLAVQLKQFIGANESVVTEFDESTGELRVTTSGFLDDSVLAGRMTIQTERAADGLLRFVSGTYGQQCQPGRGHQDFSTELCI